MAVTSTDNTVSVANKRCGRARKWLQQRIQKVVPRQTPKQTKEGTHVERKTSLKRPSTAPAIGIASRLDDISLNPTAPITTKQSLFRPLIPPPIRPARPDSSVIRDINAWLEASTNTPSPPLMSGLSYWREATVLGVKDSAAAQHAVPLSVASGTARPTTAASTQTRYFRPSAMKVQVRMPSSLHTKSQHFVDRNRTNRKSASMPPLAISYENVREGVAPILIPESKYSLKTMVSPPSWHTSTRDGALFVDQLPRDHSLPHHNASASARFGAAESDSQRRVNKMPMHTTRGADNIRPSTAAAGLVREGSMGDLSDAPTYCSGPPPPSYRSRPDSMLTTSSFGCIDGMNPAQRQISQQRAALQRGVRCRLKRLAQNFAI